MNLSIYQNKKPKESSIEFYKKSDKLNCHACSFSGQIDLFSKKGGVVCKDNQDRLNIFGSCPDCNRTIISYHI